MDQNLLWHSTVAVPSYAKVSYKCKSSPSNLHSIIPPPLQVNDMVVWINKVGGEEGADSDGRINFIIQYGIVLLGGLLDDTRPVINKNKWLIYYSDLFH